MKMKAAPQSPDILYRVEEAGLNASAPPQQLLVDGWLLRFSAGKAKRARCINAISAGRLSLEEKLALCEPVYADAQLPMLVRITPFTQPADLDELLGRRGMACIDDTRVMIAEAVTAHTVPVPPPNLSLSPIGHEAFAHAVGAFRGSTLAQRQAHGQRLAHAPVRFFAHVVRLEGEVVACGQFALEGALAGLYDVFTAPAARGRGFARLLCSHLLAEAASRGARIAYLQVEGDNHAARAVYHRLGFRDAYRYHYRSADPHAV